MCHSGELRPRGVFSWLCRGIRRMSRSPTGVILAVLGIYFRLTDDSLRHRGPARAEGEVNYEIITSGLAMPADGPRWDRTADLQVVLTPRCGAATDQ